MVCCDLSLLLLLFEPPLVVPSLLLYFLPLLFLFACSRGGFRPAAAAAAMMAPKKSSQGPSQAARWIRSGTTLLLGARNRTMEAASPCPDDGTRLQETKALCVLIAPKLLSHPTYYHFPSFDPHRSHLSILWIRKNDGECHIGLQ